jgi:bla regulator protein BlaR1
MVKKRYIISVSILLHGSILFAFTNLGAYVRKPSAVNISFDFKQIPQKPKLNKTVVQNKIITKIHTPNTIPTASLIADKNDNILEPNIARIIKYVQPIYPNLARKKGIEATFAVNLKIDENGRVISVNINEHNYLNLFKQSIENALYSWQFAASSTNKNFIVPVIFKLDT